jgi:hypothetical protein
MTPFWQVFMPLAMVGAAFFWAGRTIERIKWETEERRKAALRIEVKRHVK